MQLLALITGLDDSFVNKFLSIKRNNIRLVNLSFVREELLDNYDN